MRLIDRRLLLIAQPESYRIAPYLDAARRMGFEVLIASRGAHSLISEVFGGLHVDPDDVESSLQQILNQAGKTPFAGVLGSDDSTVELAATVACELGLPHNPPQAARLSRRKDLARAHLSQAGCRVPAHQLVDLREPTPPRANPLPWPCVLKPLHLSASRGVIRADNAREFSAACARIRPIIAGYGDDFEQNHILVEKYIDGIEVAYEGFLDKGVLHTLAVFDKPDPLRGPYFEETIYITPSRLDAAAQTLIKRRVAQACEAYGLNIGPVHAELRIDAQDAWILEVAARTIGGDCARTLDSGCDFNLEELVISLATGNPVSTSPPGGARGVMMIPIRQGGILRRVEGIMAAQRVPYIEKVDIIARDGSELTPLPEGNQYPGYIFARAESPEAVEEALRKAYAELDFVTAPLIRIAPQ